MHRVEFEVVAVMARCVRRVLGGIRKGFGSCEGYL